NRGERNILAANDWAVAGKNIVRNRKNMTLFLNRGNGNNFSPAVNFDSNVVNTTSYPQIDVKDNYAAIIYTKASYSSYMGSRQTIVTKVSPLPEDDRYYLFPRKNRGQIKMRKVDDRDAVQFYHDYSSAALDLDANDASKDVVHISFDVKVNNGNHTILSLDYP